MGNQRSLPYPWLAQGFSLLQQSYTNGRLHHALLLKGSQGSGKWDLARYIAAGLMCAVSTGLHPCGQCKSCKLHQAGNHPDSCIIDNDDGAIGIDEVRRAGEFVNKKAHIGQCQVVLIRNIENLTEPAANALLKTLEEPTKQVYLLLTSNAPERLLKTILSRCHQQTIGLSNRQMAIDFLRTQVPDLVEQQCDILLQLSGNAPLRVLDWLAQNDLEHLERAQQCFNDWRLHRLADITYARQLEQSDFERLLFIHLLKAELNQRLQGASDAAQVDLFTSLSQMLSKLTAFTEANITIKGQNTTLALVNLLVKVRTAF